jgi:hypothetical protein
MKMDEAVKKGGRGNRNVKKTRKPNQHMGKRLKWKEAGKGEGRKGEK